MATHCDADHLHSHFVINSVGFQNGKKLRQSPNTLIELRALNDEICAVHGLSVLPPYEKSGTKMSTREYRAALKGESWKFKLMADICAAMNRSGSKRDFIFEMERCGYQVRWTDERKYITFTCPNKMKCRDLKLHDNKYLKENLEYELQYREAHYGRVSRKKRKRYKEYEWPEYAGDGADSGEGLGYNGDSSGECSEFPPEVVLAGETTDCRGADDFPVVGETDKGFLNEYGQPRATGWEESRKEFERFLGKGYAVGNGYRQGSEATELENLDAHRHGVDTVLGAGGSAVRSAVYALAALSEDDEDPEERRKRIEAQENGEALGALLGLAVGAISEISEENDDEFDHKFK